MSLPEAWVSRIFEKCTLLYGQSFLRRWADIDMEAVKADWAHELGGFAQQPEAIKWALQNLPADKPPTVLEFRALCRKVPAEQPKQIEGPPADPARVAAELQKLANLRPDEKKDYRAWARRIKERRAAGENISNCAYRMALEALGEIR